MRTYDELLTDAQELSVSDKARLLADISIALRRDLAQASPKTRRRSLYGVLADLGSAPSADDIDEARRDMWKTR